MDDWMRCDESNFTYTHSQSHGGSDGYRPAFANRKHRYIHTGSDAHANGSSNPTQ